MKTDVPIHEALAFMLVVLAETKAIGMVLLEQAVKGLPQVEAEKIVKRVKVLQEEIIKRQLDFDLDAFKDSEE